VSNLSIFYAFIIYFFGVNLCFIEVYYGKIYYISPTETTKKINFYMKLLLKALKFMLKFNLWKRQNKTKQGSKRHETEN
jgi:hypothetical protein